QVRNRSITRRISINGIQLTIVEWCEKSGISYRLLDSRLRNGWSPERAINTPVRPTKKMIKLELTYNGINQSLAQWCRDFDINYIGARKRLLKGKSPAQVLNILI